MKDSGKEEESGFPPGTPGTWRNSARDGLDLPLAAYITLVRLADLQADGPFQKTAQVAGIPNSTVDYRIAQLEAFHGHTMLLKERDGFVLTPAAQALAVLARTLVETAGAIEDRRSFGRPVIRFGGYNTNFRDLTPPLLRDNDPLFDVELIPAHSKKEMLRHLRAGVTDVAFSQNTANTAADFLLDSKTFGHHLLGTYNTIPIASREHAAGNTRRVKRREVWGGKEGFESVSAVVANAKRLIIDSLSLPDIRSHIPPDIPLVLCDSLGTVTTLVRQNRGVGLMWDVPVLLADDVIRGRFQNPIRPAISLYALWRNDVLETRSKIKGDPMPLIVERLRQLGNA